MTGFPGDRVRRLALAAILVSAAGIAAAYGSAFLPGSSPPWSALLFVVSLATMLSGIMLLGAAPRRRGSGKLALLFLVLWALLAGGLGAALLLPDSLGPTTPLWLGLPRGAALVLYGVGLLPALVLPVAYAMTFDSLTLDKEDLERIRALRRRREGTGDHA